ncbi:MAG TPA: hypothetical protein VHT73_04730 [Thermodesulfobacteriota bacterium]|nr:hypothetical protein [Thermodesulfobacteriota bacterium]
MSRMGMPDKKSTKTRAMAQSVREAGFMEKKGLKERLIGYAS